MKAKEIEKQLTSDGSDLKPRQGKKRRKTSKRKRNYTKIVRPKPKSQANIIEADASEKDITIPEEHEQNVVFKPNDGPQTDFLASNEKEVLYGGAAGGGKSYALLADVLRFCNHPHHSGLILRRTNDELRELVLKSQELYPQVFPGAKWSERKALWTFPSGARIWMTYLEQDKDVLRYQGQSFTWIGVDELTQYASPYAWNYLRSRLRTVDADLPTYMRGTTNPGGPGHLWVKKMFIDPSPFNTSFWATDIENNEVLRYPKGHDLEAKPLFKRRFIPAQLTDNPYLSRTGEYEANLLSLPEVQRKQLLEGSWDIAEGAAFSEFNRDIHVVEPYEIPSSWRKFRTCDYGYSSWSACLWVAVRPDNKLIVYRELYTKKKTADELADMILQIEHEADEKIWYGILDSSCWHNRGQIGPSIAETMILRGCRWRPSDRSKGSRVAGKNELHRLLKVNEETNEAGIDFFKNCIKLISEIPQIPLSKSNPEDVDTKVDYDHGYDALRYGIMSRPTPRGLYDFSETSWKKPWKPADQVFGY